MQDSKNNSMNIDSVKLGRIFVQVIITILFLVGAIFSIKTQNYAIGAVLTILPLLMKMLSTPNIIIVLSIFSSFARFTVPGVKAAGGINAAVIFNIQFILVYLLLCAMRSVGKGKKEVYKVLLTIFGINLVFTAAVRGFGIYMFGSDMIGGTNYIILLIGFIFFNIASDFSFSMRQVRWLIVGGVIASFLPFVAQLLVYKSGGALWFLSDFFAFATSRVATALQGTVDEGVMRFETLAEFAFMLLPFPFVLKPKNAFLKLLLWSIIPIALAIMFGTGFRRLLIGAGFVLFFCSLFVSKRKGSVLTGFLVLGAAGLALIYAIAPSLPWGIQRTIAMLPGLNIDASALQSGLNSNEWRMELYSYCFEEIPAYLLLGKGLLLSLEEKLYAVSLMTGGLNHMSSAYFNFMQHAYHSGALELLLDTGLVGFLSYTAFMMVFFRSVWKRIRRLGTDTIEVRYAGCMAIIAVWKTIEYYLVTAAFIRYFPSFLAFAVLILCILNTIERARDKEVLTIDE